MRKFNGTTGELSGSFAGLASHTGGFTVAFWARVVAADISSATHTQWMTGDGSARLGVQQTGTTMGIVKVGGTGNFALDSEITIPDSTQAHFYAWRYDGAEWSKWLDFEKEVIDASLTGSLGAHSANFYVGHYAGGTHSNAYLGEIALFPFALHDAAMSELAWGVAGDQFGAVAYFPLRGNTSPEFDYVDDSRTLTISGGVVASPHIPIVPRMGLKPREIEPAWVADFYDADDQTPLFSVASRDLYGKLDQDILGAAYPSGIMSPESIRVSRQMPKGGGVVTFGDVSFSLSTPNIPSFDAATDFRGAGVLLRKYDRESHALKTAFSGIVTGRAVQDVGVYSFQCSGDHPELDTLIPRLTIGKEQSTRTDFFKQGDDSLVPFDLESPFPIACGNGGLCTGPYIERDATESPGGAVYFLSWGTDVHVVNGFGELDTDSPGLESLLVWEDVSGGGEGVAPIDLSPTYVSATTFTVTGTALDAWFVAGVPLRFKDSGGAVVGETIVASYSSGTVTTADAVVPSTIDTLEMVMEFIVERDRWKYESSHTGTNWLTTALIPGEPAYVPTFELSTAQRQAPTTLITGILGDPDWGLGGQVDGTDAGVALVRDNDFGMLTSIATVLGGDRLQRTARSLLNEACALQGRRVWKDDQGTWRQKVDGPPTKPAVPFEFGPATAQNIASLPTWWYTPLNEAVSTIRHRYGKGGRVRRTALEQADYQFANVATVTGRGSRLEIVSDFLRNHEAAARSTYYIKQRLIRSDHHCAFEATADAWRLEIGETLVDLVSVPQGRTSTTYRVNGLTETLSTYSVEAEGPYNDDIFTYDAGEVVQPDGTGNPDERPQSISDGSNMIANGDWLGGLGAEPPTSGSDDPGVFPGVFVLGWARMSSVTWHQDVQTIGGAYARFVTTADADTLPVNLRERGSPDQEFGCFPVTAGDVYLYSAYLNTDSPAGDVDGVRCDVEWYEDENDGTPIFEAPQMRLAPGDVSPKGWRRVYWVVRVPADITLVVVYLNLAKGLTTFNIDARKFERLSRGNMRPTPWSRHPSYGLQSARWGDQNVRATGQPVGGTTNTHTDSGEKTLSGASTLLMQVPAGDWKNFSGLIFPGFAVTGCDKWEIRADSASGQVLARGLPIAENTQFTNAYRAFSGDFTRAVAFDIYAVPLNSDDQVVTFTGGKVRVLAHGATYAAPTR